MALASTTRSPFVPLTFKSGSRTPHGAPRRDIAAVPTAWNPLYPTSNVSSERGTAHGIDAHRRVVLGVLSDLLIRVCGTKGLPRCADEPFPGPGSGKSLSEFDGGDHRFDIEVSGQEVWVNDGRIKGIRATEFDFSTYQEGYEGSNNPVNRMRHVREVGEMRLVVMVIQFPSGLVAITAQPFPQMNW